MRTILLLVVVFSLIGCKVTTGYRITQQGGAIIECAIYRQSYCGVYASDCSDGKVHDCMTNVAVETLPKVER